METENSSIDSSINFEPLDVEESVSSEDIINTTINNQIIDSENNITTTSIEEKANCKKFLCGDTDYVNIFVLSISFMLLFAGFHSAQGFYTSLHDNGGIVLGLLYLFYSVGSLIAPIVNKFLESKLTIIIGAQCYVLFVFLTGTNFNGFFGNLVLYFSGILCGCGSSILWTAQGNIIVKSSTRETIGFCSGIFFSFFQCSIISGFFLSGILTLLEVKTEMLFVILGWICCTGNLILFFLKDKKYTTTTTSNNNNNNYNNNTNRFCINFKVYFKSLFDTIYVLFDLKFMAYVVLFFFSGYTFGFYYGTFTKQAGTELLPWLFVDFAIMGVTGAIFFGKMGDWISRRFTLGVVLLAHFTSIVLLFLLGDKKTPTWLWFLTIAFCGISNTGLNVQIYSILGIYFKNNPPSAFAAFKVVQSLTVSFQFVTSGSVFSFFQIKIILAVSLILSFIGFTIMDILIPVDSYEECVSHNIFQIIYSKIIKSYYINKLNNNSKK